MTASLWDLNLIYICSGRSSSTIGTGNIVWDGSMSAVALLEAGERTHDPDLYGPHPGRFAANMLLFGEGLTKSGDERRKAGTLEGKKCLELGSGCAGLGGLACALLGRPQSETCALRSWKLSAQKIGQH